MRYPAWWYTLPAIKAKLRSGRSVEADLRSLQKAVEKAGVPLNDRTTVERILHDKRIADAMREIARKSHEAEVEGQQETGRDNHHPEL